MAPEFEKIVLADGRATLYRGDCRELPAAGLLKCDAVVADPPYGIGFQHSGGGIGGSVDSKICVPKKDKITGDDVAFEPAQLLTLAPIANDGAQRIILFGANNFLRKLPASGTLLAWDKNLGHGPDDSFSDCEWLWCGRSVKRSVFRHLWKGVACKRDADDCSPTKGDKVHGGARFARAHVSQKPVALMRWCIQKLKPPPGGVILDPYAGSGSTGIAALSLGYRFTGVEIDPGHFDTMRQRIEAWWAEHGSDAA